MGRERGNHRGRESSDVEEEIESGASLKSGSGESSTDREARGGIRLTWGGWGHTVSAHWSEPRARALFPRLATRTNAISRTNRELRDLSDEERLSSVLRHAACQ